MEQSKQKRIVLGITGGIAAYKAAELARLLVKRGIAVQVAMTQAATHFITPTTMQALSGNPVLIDQWQNDSGMAHIHSSREADAILIAPATADFIAKLALGLADDLLSTLCLARDCPLLIAPAMNKQMWANPATQRNVKLLVADGVTVLGPLSGLQACGEEGMGRMLEAEELARDVLALLQTRSPAQPVTPAANLRESPQFINDRQNLDREPMGISPLSPGERARVRVETLRCDKLMGTHTPSPPAPLPEGEGSKTIASSRFMGRELAGVKILITAGPTYEAIDAVRGITNRSSGKMGYAIAQAARELGAEVTLISGPTALARPDGTKVVDVSSAAEMFEAVKQFVDAADIFIGVAAVADYRVAHPSQQKIKKNGGNLTLELIPNPDILAFVADLPNAPFCVGFAAESENLREYAEQKRRAKKLPLLAANLAQQALGADDNELILFDDAGEHLLPRADKLTLARALLLHAATLYQKGKSQ